MFPAESCLQHSPSLSLARALSRRATDTPSLAHGFSFEQASTLQASCSRVMNKSITRSSDALGSASALSSGPHCEPKHQASRSCILVEVNLLPKPRISLPGFCSAWPLLSPSRWTQPFQSPRSGQDVQAQDALRHYVPLRSTSSLAKCATAKCPSARVIQV